MFDLHGEIALVTGAGTGLGKAIAIELSRCGADVIVAKGAHPTSVTDS